MPAEKPVLGLGLESSCDETAAAVVRDGNFIMSNIISSQIDIHRAYNGVVPEIASRAHLESINAIMPARLTRPASALPIWTMSQPPTVPV
jgi:N6-L-threonylcarbamoyladenine synthase